MASIFTAQGALEFLGLVSSKPPRTLDETRVPGWQSRLREAAYTPPSGERNRIKFQYVDVSREFDLRGTAHEFPQVNDAFVQRTGFGSRRYPLTCYFSGPNCDLLATAFEKALMEPGMGVLDHPIYGSLKNVVPFGTVTRNDALATGANQSVIQVTFWTTADGPYPSLDPYVTNEIERALGQFDIVHARHFEGKMDLGSASSRAQAIATIKGYLKTVSGAMSKVSTATASLRREMQDITDTLNSGMDVLIGQPLLLAQQISNLVLAPARAVAGIESRLDGYSRLVEGILGSSAARPAQRLATNGSALLATRVALANDFHVADFFVTSAVAGSVLSSVKRPAAGSPPIFSTRTQAIAAAAAVADLFSLSVYWRESGYAALGGMGGVSDAQIDTGESYQDLQEAASKAGGYLVQTSFGLQAERRIILDRARTIIDLCAELYGSVDDKLDLLIDSNDLTGDEILELPAGKSIVYYPG